MTKKSLSHAVRFFVFITLTSAFVLGQSQPIPKQIDAADPYIYVPCYVLDDQGAVDTIVRFPYSWMSQENGSGGAGQNGNTGSVTGLPAENTPAVFNPANVPDPEKVAVQNQTGGVWGMAYDPFPAANAATGRLFFASYAKQRSFFGPNGPGAIYVIRDPGNTTLANVPDPELYVNLNTVFGNGTAGQNNLNPNNIFGEVGKTSLGDLDISPDGSTLYVVNLQDRQLYLIPTSGTLNSTTITRFPIPLTEPAGLTNTFNAANIRPFGIGVTGDGEVYVGGVYSADTTEQSDNTSADLRGLVWRFTGSGFQLVLNFPLNYERPDTRDWNPWDDATNLEDSNGNAYPNGGTVGRKPEPMLSDITFDGNGVILGLRDRFGDKCPLSGAAFGPDAGFPRANGDILRAFVNGSGTWELESNGAAGPVTSGGGAGNAEGPGGGEFFWQDEAGDADVESSLGSVTYFSGKGEVLSLAFDAAAFKDAANGVGIGSEEGDPFAQQNINAAGVQRFRASDGAYLGGYDVYLLGDVQGGDLFAKANGVGDLEVIAPQERDFGDAPDTYDTLAASGGPSHVIVPGLKIGSSIDDETDGNPTTAANGDGADDNDVTFPDGTSFSANVDTFVAKVVVMPATAGSITLTATDDFNSEQYDQGNGWSGVWTESGTADGPAAGDERIKPADADPNGSSLSLFPDGQISLCVQTGGSISRTFDFSNASGDATVSFSWRRDDWENDDVATITFTSANNTTQTIFEAGGAGGGISDPISYVQAGSASPTDPQPTTENLTIPLALLAEGEGTITVSATGASPSTDFFCLNDLTISAPTGEPKLVAWLDFDRDGEFQADEATVVEAADLIADSTTENMIMWNNVASLIPDGTVGQTYARFRLSTDPTLDVSTPGGALGDGEVEDYALEITAAINATIGNRVFVDANDNGVLDDSERGLANVTVNLLDADNGNALLQTQQTSGTGRYLFNVTPGNYIVEVILPPTFSLTSQNMGGDETIDSDFDPITGLTATILVTGPGENIDVDAGVLQSLDAICFAVANQSDLQLPGGGDDPNDDILYIFDESTDAWVQVGPTGVNQIEGITLDTSNRLFAFNINQFGEINTQTGEFSPIGNPISSLPDGPLGEITGFGGGNDVDGMSYDPYRDRIWCTLRRSNLDFDNNTPDTLNDLLFLVDPATGALVEDAFGPGNDYAVLEEVFDPNVPVNVNPNFPSLGNGRDVYDVDDIAFDTATGNLFAVQNANGTGGVLTEINPADGSLIRAVGDFNGIDDIEGLCFDFNGNLFGTSGDNGPDPADNNTFWSIDKTTSSVTLLQAIPAGANNANDFESIDCFSRPLGLGNVVWLDTNNDGVYQPDTEDGIQGVEVQLFPAGAIPGQDDPFDTEVTDADGEYAFIGLPEGDFFVYLPSSNFNPSGPLAGLASSTGNGIVPSDPDDDVNNDDNGQPDGLGAVLSREITLVIGDEPGTDTNFTLDFGFTTDPQLSSLGNFVFFDTNQNGVQDSGELGIADVTVRLLDGDDPATVLNTTATLGNGFYSFESLPAGNYIVEFVSPAGFTISPKQSGAATSATDSDADPITGRSDVIALPADTDDPTIDAGFFRSSAAIGDRVWIDENGDGEQDAGEGGIPNVLVKLLSADGSQTLATTRTDNDGRYLFKDLTPGSYTVMIDPNTVPAALRPNPTFEEADNSTDPAATPDGMTVVTVAAGDERLSTDFGFNYNSPTETDTPAAGALAAIGDRVWLDANSDGVQDENERGIAGVTMKLLQDENGSGLSDGVFDTPVSDGQGGDLTVTTDANGYYIFDSLPAGPYVVMVDDTTLPAGLVQTGDPDGTLDNMSTSPVVLAPGDVVLLEDFGYNTGGNTPAELYTISGIIFLDADADGANAPGTDENPFNGVTVSLKDMDGNVLASTVTGPDGSYSFPGLTDGNYVVMVIDAANVLEGLKNTADPDDADDGSHVVIINGGDETDQNFGYVPESQDPGEGLIGDTVFLDIDGDGSPDPGEGIEGVTVELRDESGNLLATAETDENGNYFFGGLDPDATYTVTVVGSTLPDGVSNTVDPNGGGDSTTTVTLTPGSPIDLTADFGYQGLNSLSGTVWEDTDAAGDLDETGTGFEGVTVVLINAETGDLVATTITDTNGDFSFANLPDGNFQVDVTDEDNVLNGYWKSDGPNDGDNNNSQDDPYTVNLDAAGNSGTAVTDETSDFGYYQDPGAIGNLVFTDADNSGTNNAGDSPIADALLKLTITYPNTDTVEVFTMTDDTGLYAFTNLLLDENDNGTTGGATHSVMVVGATTPSTYDGTPDTAGLGNGTDDNSDNPMGEAAFPPQGGVDNTNDFGFFEASDLGSVGDVVFLDLNNNGTRDPGEGGIDGLTVMLLDTSDNMIDQTTTQNGGAYLFENVPADTSYQIKVTPAVGLGEASGSTPGSNDTTEGNSGTQTAVGQPSIASNVTVPAAGENLNVDFGFVPRYGLGNLIFIDREPTSGGDENGLFDDPATVQDSNDARAPAGIQINLLDGNGDPFLSGGNPVTTMTDSQGRYLFPDLLAGKYIIEVDSSAFTNSAPFFEHNATFNNGGDNGLDDDANQNGRVSPDPTLTGIRTNVIMLGPDSSEPISTGDETGDDNGADTTADRVDANYDLTVDIGVREFVVDPQGCFYVSGVGTIVPGGSITITGQEVGTGTPTAPNGPVVPANKIIVAADGSTGCYSWYVENVTDAVYCVEYTAPPGYVIDPAFSFTDNDNNLGNGEDPYDPPVSPGQADITIGQLDGDNDGTLDATGGSSGSLTANPAYRKFLLADGDPLLNGINIPLLKAQSYSDFLLAYAAYFNLDDNSQPGVPGGTNGSVDTDGDDRDTSLAANDDGDAYNNLLEFALCFNPGSGVKTLPDGSPNEGFHLVLDGNDVDAVFTRPNNVDAAVNYTIQTYNLTNNIWVDDITITPTVTDNANSTETVTFDAVNTAAVAGDTKGLLRLKVESGGTTSFTGVQGYQVATVKNFCQTYSDPLLTTCVFTGTVTGQNVLIVDLSGSLTSEPLTNVLQPGSSYYLEVTAGDNEGQIFDIASFDGTTVTLAADTDQCALSAPYSTTDPTTLADLAGDSVVIREHKTISELFPIGSTEFTEGVNSTVAGKIIRLDRSTDPVSLETYFADSATSGWINSDGGAAVGDQILPPGEAVFTHNAETASDFMIMQIGEVRCNRLAVPLKAGYNFVAAAHPVIDQKPNSADTQSRLLNNDNTGGKFTFTGSGARGRADLIERWRDDDAATLADIHLCYDSLFYGVFSTTNQWTEGGRVPNNFNDEAIFKCTRGMIYRLYENDRLDYYIPSPIQK